MIVFITIPWFLPAYRAGGPIQSVANLVENFNEGVTYRIFCGATDLNGEALEGIETGKWLRYNDYTQVWYAEKDEISKTITIQTEKIKPDVLYIIGLFSWHFNTVPMIFGTAKKKILSVRGMLHPGALSQKQIKKHLFLDALKITGIQKKIVFHATDEAEQEYIKKEFGKQAKIEVASNFGKVIKKQKSLLKEKGILKLLSVALISPMKNHLPVLKALSHCTQNIEYNIFGPVKDFSYWQQCLQVIKFLPENIKVQYHGEISPASVCAVLNLSHVFILPSKSENFGHAIFEALSAGKPVITSHATPWNNLQENTAGINTEPAEKELQKAIEFFADMDNDAYLKYSEGTSSYIILKNNYSKLRAQYTNMFSVNKT